MTTCGEAGSDVDALIKELAIRWVENRLETHSNEVPKSDRGNGSGTFSGAIVFGFI